MKKIRLKIKKSTIERSANKARKILLSIPYYEFVFPLLVFLFIVLIGFWKGLIDFNNFILLATLCALLWYSFETRQLKNATRTSNELQQEPVLSLRYKDKPKKKLFLKNEGKGLAYNIKIDSIFFGNDQFNFRISDVSYFEQEFYLSPGEEKELFLQYRRGKTNRYPFIEHFLDIISKHETQDCEQILTVQYISKVRRRTTEKFIIKYNSKYDNFEVYPF